ncbi:MAG: ribbon-helix-helix domain-containing protein [Aigarchaeota archaeon]|nr:ribbon-helix-helix domain-containing protein [Aigarchaeota archaeon]MCS7117239.1 ribbon-helix-helix domain-containing protein [Candidatus Calditenuaceae archaeon]MDW8041240.1 ribbon-helix-helix domain-containing protein [Nitrososphaerota archaeon]
MSCQLRVRSGLRPLTVRLPDAYLDALEELVDSGVYVSVAEAVRMAIRDLIAREGFLIKGVKR